MIIDIFYDNKKLLKTMVATIKFLNRQNYRFGLVACTECIDLLTKQLPSIIEEAQTFEEIGVTIDIENITYILSSLQQAQITSDYVLMADLIESALMPLVVSMQEALVANWENHYELLLGAYKQSYCIDYKKLESYQNLGYIIEPTSHGFATLAIKDKDGKIIYYHSNISPIAAAMDKAFEWYDGTKFHYVVLGLGLGYDVLQLIQISDAIIVDVYEPRKEIIELANIFGVLSQLKECGQVNIHFDCDLKMYNNAITDAYTKSVIHYPTVQTIEDETLRENIENYYIRASSYSNQEMTMLRSFVENQKVKAESANVLHKQLEGRDVYVIAAGPSLDKNIDELKNVKDKGIILATGTVLKKMLRLGIRPDYVVIIDANHTTYKQVEGITKCDVPMIFLSTAYYEAVNDYKAKKYIACQEGYFYAEQLAENNNWSLYSTGGSVTTLCIDLALRAGCRRLITVGLDLALTGALIHGMKILNLKDCINT